MKIAYKKKSKSEPKNSKSNNFNRFLSLNINTLNVFILKLFLQKITLEILEYEEWIRNETELRIIEAISDE